VFITTHAELAYLTFKHKIEAMDFIVKDRPEDMATRMVECVLAAYERYLQEKSEQMRYFKIDANDEVWRIPHDDIIFFETSSKASHRIILHTENGEIDFRGALSEIEQLIPELYRCHKSYLLNLAKIAYIDKATKEAVMMNGERTHIAEKKMSELVGMIGDR